MSAAGKKSEVRTSWQARSLGTMAGWVMRIWSWTIRMEVEDRCGFTAKGAIKDPLIWCIWHNRMLALAMARKRVYPWREGVVLTSASHDGAALAAAVKVIGVGAVRGSSSRRGTAALKEMVRQLKAGKDVGVTPDGPRGPRYELNPGLVKLAQVANLPIMCFHVRYGRAIRLKTWDRFVIPLPLSKISIVFDTLLAVPRGLDDDGFETTRREIENRMREGVDDLHLPTNDHSRRKKNRR
jgi:lysophospholipid acyltransferase (LPLAT)-like uncharacterized protein